MRTILGPFHPDLENALVDEISRFKRSDPMTPLLVLVPADLMRRRLKILLSRERGLSLLNVQLLTFYQLSLRLQAERSGSPLELQDDLFLEEALRQIIRTRQPGAEPFAGIEDRAGGCAALWQTLRDLRDGLVDPTVALEALGEGHFSQRASERTSQLLVLFRTLQRFCREQDIVDQANLARYATEQAPSSQFLAQFAQVIYYGFYDLTQIQIDFFQAVTRHYPTTLFFPLVAAKPSHEAWRFAENFYERYILGHITEAPVGVAPETPLPASARLFDDQKDRIYARFPTHWRCQITTTFGIHDEVSAAAKQILRLIDDDRMQFHEIGVIARSLESYGSVVKDIFHRHLIPLAGAIEEALVQCPLSKAVILLLNLPAKDFLRSQVIDLVSSPYFKSPDSAKDDSLPRPDLWDLATRELAICKGAAQWRRLRNYHHRDLLLSEISDDDEPRVIRIPAAQLVKLADTVEALVADLVSLPIQASWKTFAEAWKKMLEKYLGIVPSDDIAMPGAEAAPATINDEILAVLERLAGLDALQECVTLGDFSHTFQHWLERSTVSEDRRNRDGVMVLSATAARGLSFRALFLLGMNEGVFPRTIREDAFLRDHDREVLERDLGYKVNPKLTAFDEEKLLFALLVAAPRERLYCSFQRADDSGRALAPSWYVDELKRAVESAGHKVEMVTIPRSITEKAATAPFDRQEFLLPTELAVRLTLAGQDPTALIEALAPLPALYQQGRKVVAALDQSSERLLAYDGMVGKFDHYWKRFSERGLSPTALETYARCPFQFFARHVLGLATLDRPEEILGPSPAEFGELGHEILNSLYRELMERGHFAGNTSADIDAALKSVANRAFHHYESENPVGYPLTWETFKERVVQLLRQVVTEDFDELAKSGFTPLCLEKDVLASLPTDWPEPLKNLAIRGRMDRIDGRDGALRVIDYKFKFGAAPKTEDKNLLLAALRGQRLQPPFYILLAAKWARESAGIAKAPSIEADFYYIAQHWAGGPLLRIAYGSDSLADKAGAATQQTIAYLVDGVRQGNFFLNRAEHCGRCDVATICRKNHPPSLWRAENDPLTEAHRALGGKDPKKL